MNHSRDPDSAAPARDGALPAAPVFHPSPTTAVEAFLRGRHKLRVLVVSAAPVGDGAPLDLRREWLLLQREARAGDVPAMFYRLLPPTREAFEQALRACDARGVPPHVFHFAGHGQPGDLAFEDARCTYTPFRREALADALKGRGVRLAVLNACHTATRETVSLARYLHEVGAVEAAIGHERPVSDDAAALFASHVYRGLCRGHTVLHAFAAAESALASTHPGAARATQLFGGDRARLAEIATDEAGAPLAFDGTSGRGRMTEVAHFYGRAEELVEVGAFFDDTTLRAMAIAGVGGIGKTTLAQEAANRHAWRFPGGLAFASVRSFHFGKPTAEALVRSAATALMVPDASGPAFAEQLLGHLGRHPGLLVFDNLEDLSDDEIERLLRFLAELPLNGTKALLTLRPAPQLLHAWPWVRARVLAEGLAPRAGAAYVVHVARDRVPEIAAARRDETGVYQGLPLHLTLALGGHPEMLNWAVGIAATRGVPELTGAVPELREGDRLAAAARLLAEDAMSTRMAALLASSLRLLDDESRRVLGVLSVFPDGTFTREELAVATSGLMGSSEGDEAAQDDPAAEAARRALGAWGDAALVSNDAGADVFRVHATVQSYAAEGERLDGDAAGRVFIALLVGALHYVVEHHEHYDALDRRLDHLLGLFETGWNLEGAPEQVQRSITRAIDGMGYFLYHRGYWPIMARWQERLRAVVEEDPRTRSHRLYRESLLLAGQGKLADARARLREATQIDDETGDRQGRAASLRQLASIEHRQGNHAEARALLRESIQVANELGDRPGHGASLHELAIIEYRQGYYTEARALLRASIQIADELGGRRDRAVSLHQLAIIEESQGNYAEARALLRESIQIADELGDRQSRAASLHQLASIEYSQGNYTDARALLRESIQVADELGDRHGREASLYQLSIIEESQGNHAEARALLHESIQIADELGDRQGRAASLHQLVIIEESQGNHAEARALLRESIQIADELGNRQSRAASLHQLASIEHSQGNYAEARALLGESIQIAGELGDRKGRAASLHQLASIEESQGNHVEARALLRESIQIAGELGDRKGRAASLHQLASIEESQGNHAEAHALLRESIQILDELRDRRGRAASLHLLASIEESQGNYADARALLHESIQIAGELGDRQGRAASLHQLASIEESQGNYTDARALLRASIQIEDELGNRQGRAASLIMLGQLEGSHGRLDVGKALVREGVAILEDLGDGEAATAREILRAMEGSGGRSDGGSLQHAHAVLSGERLKEAIAHASAALDEAREAGDRGREATALFLLGQGLLDSGEAAKAAAQFEAAVALLEQAGAAQEAEVVRHALAAAQIAAGTRDPTRPRPPGAVLNAAAHALRGGRPEEAICLLRDAEGLSEDPAARAMAGAIESQALVAVGRSEEGLALLTQAIADAAAAGLREAVDGLRGLADQLRPMVEIAALENTPAEELERRAADPIELASLLVKKIIAAAQADRANEAKELLARARAAAEASKAPTAVLEVLVIGAQVLAIVADPEGARAMLAEARPLAQQHARQALATIEEIELALRGGTSAPP